MLFGVIIRRYFDFVVYFEKFLLQNNYLIIKDLLYTWFACSIVTT